MTKKDKKDKKDKNDLNLIKLISIFFLFFYFFLLTQNARTDINIITRIFVKEFLFLILSRHCFMLQSLVSVSILFLLYLHYHKAQYSQHFFGVPSAGFIHPDNIYILSSSVVFTFSSKLFVSFLEMIILTFWNTQFMIDLIMNLIKPVTKVFSSV